MIYRKSVCNKRLPSFPFSDFHSTLAVLTFKVKAQQINYVYEIIIFQHINLIHQSPTMSHKILLNIQILAA